MNKHKRFMAAVGAMAMAMALAAGQAMAAAGFVDVSGSTGKDFSANAPAVPVVGGNFAASGPYASYVLVATVPYSPTRFSIDVENNSGAQIALVIDDGVAAVGAAPNNPTVFALVGGTGGVGSQGGSFVSATNKERIQVYAPSSSAQVAIRQN